VSDLPKLGCVSGMQTKKRILFGNPLDLQ